MIGYLQTVQLLMHYAKLRSYGRAAHQQRVLNARKTEASVLSGLAVLGMFVFAAMSHGIYGWLAGSLDEEAGKAAVEAQGKMAATKNGMSYLRSMDSKANTEQKLDEWEIRNLDGQYRRHGRERDDYIETVREHFAEHGSSGFEAIVPLRETAQTSPRALRAAGWISMFVIGWWFIMLAFQGEGLEMDMQRRRHPMWEWLLSHPVRPSAVFLAEMLSPLASNLSFLSAPLFWAILYQRAHGQLHWVTGIIAGIPVMIAACCVAKAIEITVMLRFAPRTRGAVLGFMGWLGYASFFAALFVLQSDSVHHLLAKGMWKLSSLPALPVAEWMIGYDGTRMLPIFGVLSCWVIAGVLIVGAVALSSWATQRGLAGNFGGSVSTPAALEVKPSRRWLRDPLHRKELLWFIRDRSAVVQVFLIPLTMAAAQSYNLRNLANAVGDSWEGVAGLVVLLGTYFLLVLGPRSLVSEGAALWIPLTWPCGLEKLMSSKAKLWWMVASGIVFIGLLAVAICFPAHWWRLLLLFGGWLLFSASLSRKSVTLVRPVSSSGEAEPASKGQQWGAMLGTFTFAIGVMTQNWALAFVGIVYSWLTAAAMWQTFRSRLPYLFDAWSEPVLKPPTLVHTMVAIAAMLEGIAVVSGIAHAFAGGKHQGFAMAVGYGLVATLAWLIMSLWLSSKDVPDRTIWRWEERSAAAGAGLWAMPVAIIAGLGLGMIGLLYTHLIQFVPDWAEAAHKSSELLSDPTQRTWILLMACAFAPFAEEYFFRGLLYRGLDREWGGWRALVGGALFFAIFHPPLAWAPVALVGFFNAWLFRRSGLLFPCVITHAIYNAVVLLVPSVL